MSAFYLSSSRLQLKLLSFQRYAWASSERPSNQVLSPQTSRISIEARMEIKSELFMSNPAGHFNSNSLRFNDTPVQAHGVGLVASPQTRSCRPAHLVCHTRIILYLGAGRKVVERVWVSTGAVISSFAHPPPSSPTPRPFNEQDQRQGTHEHQS